MSLLSCLLLFLTLMAFSSASPKKEMEEAKMMTSSDASMARGSLFNIGSLIHQKIQNKKKFFSSILAKKKSIKIRIQNKKKLISTYIGKKKGIKNKWSVIESAATSKKEVDEAKPNADASMARGSLFGIGNLKKKLFSSILAKNKNIKNKIHNKKKQISTYIAKKMGIKNKRSLLEFAATSKKDVDEAKPNAYASMARGSLFGIGNLKKKLFSSFIAKKKSIKNKIQNKKKLIRTIISKKTGFKNKRSVLISAATPKEDIDEPKPKEDTSKSRWSLFGMGSLIQHKIQNIKKKLFSNIIAKKESIKNKIQNKKKQISTFIAKKMGMKNKRSVLDSAATPKEDIDEASMTRGPLFGIGSLIQQQIQNQKKLFSAIVAKKKGIKNKILSKTTRVLVQ